MTDGEVLHAVQALVAAGAHLDLISGVPDARLSGGGLFEGNRRHYTRSSPEHLQARAAGLANSPTLTIQGRIRQVHAFFRQRTPSNGWPPPRQHSSPWLPDGYLQTMSAPRQLWWRPPNCQSWISTLAYSPACT